MDHNKLWKILKEMWITDHLIKKQHLELDMKRQIGSKLRKESIKAAYCHPCLFYLYTEYIMRNSGLDEAQAGIKTARRNINLRYYPYGRKQRGTEEPLDESEKGEWKSWHKVKHSENKDHGIWSHHFMGNRWGKWKQCQTLFWGAPKSPQMIAAMKLKNTSWKESYDQPR